MAKKVVVLRQREKKASPKDAMEALNGVAAIVKQGQEMIGPLQELETLSILLKAIEEGLGVHAETAQAAVRESAANREETTKTLATALTSLKAISKDFSKTAAENRKASEINARVITDDNVAALDKVVGVIEGAMSSSNATNKMLLEVLTAVLGELAKDTTMGTVKATVTERDAMNMIKSFEMTEMPRG